MADQSVISGIVRDSAGRPVAQARVYFTDGPVPFPDIAVLTDSAGAFSLAAPAPGSYRIECQAEGFQPVATTVTVTGGRPLFQEFRLKR